MDFSKSGVLLYTDFTLFLSKCFSRLHVQILPSHIIFFALLPEQQTKAQRGVPAHINVRWWWRWWREYKSDQMFIKLKKVQFSSQLELLEKMLLLMFNIFILQGEFKQKSSFVV